MVERERIRLVYDKHGVYWEDALTQLPGVYRAHTKRNSCWVCGKKLVSGAQVYMTDVPVLRALKKRFRKVSQIRTKQLVVVNAQLVCGDCVVTNELYHKVVLEVM